MEKENTKVKTLKGRTPYTQLVLLRVTTKLTTLKFNSEVFIWSANNVFAYSYLIFVIALPISRSKFILGACFHSDGFLNRDSFSYIFLISQC